MKTMTDTPAESAEDPRTPEPRFSVTTYAAAIRGGDDVEAILRVAIRYAVRAALAALNAQWKEALLQYEGCAFWIAAEQHSCPKCAALRALLSGGRGK